MEIGDIFNWAGSGRTDLIYISIFVVPSVYEIYRKHKRKSFVPYTPEGRFEWFDEKMKQRLQESEQKQRRRFAYISE